MTAALAICLSMAACGDTAKDESSEKETTAATTTAAEEETEATEEEPAEAEEGGEDYESGSAKAPEGVQEYNIAGCGMMDDVYSLDLIIDEDYENYFQVKLTDEELYNALFSFYSNFTIKTDASSGELGDYELILKETGENLGQLDAEGIRNACDPTVNYEVIDFSLDEDVNLSELEVGKLYKAPAVEEMPQFINDTDTDYIVWIMDDFEFREQAFTRPVKEIEGVGRAEEFMTFFGENTYVRIEPLTVDMLDPMNMGQPQTVFVNGLNPGDYADIGSATILANAGDEDVDIEITLLEGDTVEMTVKAGEIYATDWMTVSSIVIK